LHLSNTTTIILHCRHSPYLLLFYLLATVFHTKMASLNHDEPSGTRSPTHALPQQIQQQVVAYIPETSAAPRTYLEPQQAADAPAPPGNNSNAPPLVNEVRFQVGYEAVVVEVPLTGYEIIIDFESGLEEELIAEEWEILEGVVTDEVLGGNGVLIQAGAESPSMETGSSFGVEEEEVAVSNEAFPTTQAGTEETSEDDGTTVQVQVVIDDSDDSNERDAASAASDAGAPDDSETSYDDSDDEHDSGNTADHDAANAQLAPIPYPAPAEMLAESRRQPPRRGWALWEQDACIRHMLDINGEGVLRGESRFTEALRRMQAVDGCQRNGLTAVKNFWNRFGRARSGFDERRNKRAPLATSKQGKKASKVKITVRAATASKVTKARKSDNKQKKNRRQKTPTPSEDEEEERASSDSSGEDAVSDYSALDSDNEEPEHLRRNRKRKSPDDSDDDDDTTYNPNSGVANAVAKGVGAPKRARTAAAC
jgi:hypothetical protein